jgi:hypothetical protein
VAITGDIIVHPDEDRLGLRNAWKPLGYLVALWVAGHFPKYRRLEDGYASRSGRILGFSEMKLVVIVKARGGNNSPGGPLRASLLFQE